MPARRVILIAALACSLFIGCQSPRYYGQMVVYQGRRAYNFTRHVAIARHRLHFATFCTPVYRDPDGFSPTYKAALDRHYTHGYGTAGCPPVLENYGIPVEQGPQLTPQYPTEACEQNSASPVNHTADGDESNPVVSVVGTIE